MIKINQILRYSIILKVIFIFTGFFLSKAEYTSDIAKEYCDNLIQSRTELYISVAYKSDGLLSKHDKPGIQPSVLYHSQVVFSIIYKYTLNHYHNYVLNQLNLYKYCFALNHELIALRQKYNIWHKSSCENPIILG